MKNQWKKDRLLGLGSYGTVRLGIPTTSDYPQIAIKSATYPRSCSLLQEKNILAELYGCPNIIRCFGDTFTMEDNKVVYNLLLEYAHGGTLSDLIIRSGGGKLPEFEVRICTRMILYGLLSMHERGYVQCDLKPRNILVFPNSHGNCVKITDFGLSKKVGGVECDSQFKCMVNGTCLYQFPGTPLYMPPESVTKSNIGTSIDIWSLRCILIDLVTGQPPWSCEDEETLIFQLAFNQVEPTIPEEMPESGKDFLRRCFERDPQRRWTAKMLLYHPYTLGI